MVRSVSAVNSVKTRIMPNLKKMSDKTMKAEIDFNKIKGLSNKLELPSKINMNSTKDKAMYACDFDFIFCGGEYGVGFNA